MRGDEKSNLLNVMDKKLITAIKEGDWAAVQRLADELKAAIDSAAPSRGDKNWRPDPELSAEPEKMIARAVAEGFGGEGYFAEVPTCLGLLGDNLGRGIELAILTGARLSLFEFSVSSTAEDIYKALRNLIVHSVFFRAFVENPRQFGYNTEKSPLLLEGAELSWELVAPKDLINPRRTDMRWGERDVQEMQKLMKGLGVKSFSLGRLQAEAVPLQNSIGKGNLTPAKARQWFENRSSVTVA